MGVFAGFLSGEDTGPWKSQTGVQTAVVFKKAERYCGERSEAAKLRLEKITDNTVKIGLFSDSY